MKRFYVFGLILLIESEEYIQKKPKQKKRNEDIEKEWHHPCSDELKEIEYEEKDSPPKSCVIFRLYFTLE